MAISREQNMIGGVYRVTAIAGASAAAALVTIGTLANIFAFNAESDATTSGALGPGKSATTTVKTAPSAPETPSASPTVKAPPYGKDD